MPDFNALFNSLKSVAEKSIGRRKPSQKRSYTSDPLVISMSNERHKLRNQMNNNSVCDRTEIRRNINKLQKNITKRLKELKEELADNIAQNINHSDSCRQMFEAVKLLKSSSKQAEIVVHNNNNETVMNDKDKAEFVKVYFTKHFTGDEPAIAAFQGIPRPLNTPITSGEVKEAAKRLKNNKSNGPDNIPNELLKYAPDRFYEKYSELINKCFEQHEFVNSFGEGYLTPLQKPKKPKGPLKNLRPLCFLNGTRKIMSINIIALRRIKNKHLTIVVLVSVYIKKQLVVRILYGPRE